MAAERGSDMGDTQRDTQRNTQRIGIVWNPSKTSRDELETALELGAERAGTDVHAEWFETGEDDPGAGAAAAALEAGAEILFAAGGDGTVRAVAEHLAEAWSSAHSEADLGIAPLGTGNLLARNLGVPLGNPAAAFEHALLAEPRAIDLGLAEVEIDGETQRLAFAVMAGFGIDAHMITETDSELKAKAGWLAYVESMGRALSASGVISLRLEVDGDHAETTDAHTLIVGNCGMLQGGIMLLPDADPSDGELDMLLLDASGIGGWLDTMHNMVWNNGLKRLIGGTPHGAESSGSVSHRRFHSLNIELGEPRMFQIDGDEVGETTRISISTLPGALRVRA